MRHYPKWYRARLYAWKRGLTSNVCGFCKAKLIITPGGLKCNECKEYNHKQSQ